MQLEQAANIRTAALGDAETAIAAVVMAFSADPAARWMYPDSRQYLRHFPEFVKVFGGKAFRYGSAYVTDNGWGAALWLPPEVSPNEAELVRLIETTADEGIRDDLFRVFAEMGCYHPPVPHWYLPMIGVDLPWQGRGLGSALMRHALEQCDADGVPAYLESSNPRNIPLYERHGFELLGEIRAGSSPPILPMIRRPH